MDWDDSGDDDGGGITFCWVVRTVVGVLLTIGDGIAWEETTVTVLVDNDVETAAAAVAVTSAVEVCWVTY